MTITPGSRIGSYEISAPLGEGGMGDVYRATDSKLKREVAIKVLPEAVAADGDRFLLVLPVPEARPTPYSLILN